MSRNNAINSLVQKSMKAENERAEMIMRGRLQVLTLAQDLVTKAQTDKLEPNAATVVATAEAYMKWIVNQAEQPPVQPE